MTDKILLFLDGNKMKISAILSAIIGYLVLVGLIDGNTATLIITIINILGGSAQVITGLAVQNNTNLGVSIRNKRLNNLR
jgi:hypothetical protein